jgi:amino acid adenylation domain-containing protein
MLLHHLFEDSASRIPNKVGLITKTERHTYRELASRVERLAGYLVSAGVRKGDRVALYLPNSVELIVGILAALRAGAAFVPINVQTKTEKLTYILADAGPSAVVTDERSWDRTAKALERNESVRACVVAGEARENGSEHFQVISLAAAERLDISVTSDADVIDQDLAAIIYTSGSTGSAKGVMLSHRNMTTAAGSVSSYLGLRESDVIFCALPLSFDYGLYQILMGFKVGATVVLEKSFAFPVQVLGIMERERVTVFPGVPTMFSLLLALERLSEFDLASLRMITNTGAALSRAHIDAVTRAFPQAELFSMYGLTECKRVSYLPPDELSQRPGSVGRGMPNQELWLEDERGNRLPPGSTGELIVRGSHVMLGYWGKPEETNRYLKPGPYPGERVLRTGDLFRMDEDGYLYFLGRKDDVIKSRGEKVSPKEVETVIQALEGTLDAAVIGVPDSIDGQAVKAFVTLRPGFDHAPRDVIRHCAQHLENHMIPKYVCILDSLPKTANGKIDKARLHDEPSAPASRRAACGT